MPALESPPRARLTLRADTAGDLMSPNPISVRHEAGVREAIALLTDRDINAAPVIDDNGRPVGVISVTDILIHDREYAAFLKTSDGTAAGDLRRLERMPADMGVEVVDPTKVEDIMTPTVFTVKPETPATVVVQEMLSQRVHHLFVADSEGTLVGVISAGDILRHLG
ncbi:MAG: HPP family protein [Gemmataceae bacterium]